MEGDDQEARMIRATMLSCLLALALTCWGCSLAAWHSDDPIKRACVREAHNEALSTVMKLVKAALPEGSNLAGYAKELDRS